MVGETKKKEKKDSMSTGGSLGDGREQESPLRPEHGGEGVA